MIIRNNLTAMNAQRNFKINNKEKKSSTENLASGVKINRSGEDAAGLAISEKMRSQIKSLQRSTANAQDGVSLLQTAEGALAETHDMLRRVKELAVQSINSTLTDEDRRIIDDEAQHLLDEIDQIAEKTEFNTSIILGGGTATPQGASNINYRQQMLDDAIVSLTNQEISAAIKFASAADKFKDKIPFEKSIADLEERVKTLNVYAVGLEGQELDETLNDIADLKNNILKARENILQIEASGIALEAQAASLADFAVSMEMRNVKSAATELQKAILTGKDPNMYEFQVGANQGQKIRINIMELNADALGLGATRLSTRQSASLALEAVDTAVNTISSQRAELGAVQNTLEHTIKNVDNTNENLQSAESLIRDTDIGEETVKLTRHNILAQAAQSMLSQANQNPDQVLQLL